MIKGKLLIKFPTRERPKKFFEMLDLYESLLSGKHHHLFMIVCDSDDETMNNSETIARLDSYQNLVYLFGDHRSKIEAINTSVNGNGTINDCRKKIATFDFDVLLLASDDMMPVARGYDDIIFQAMRQYFPDTDGVLFFNDGFAANRTNTLCIMGRKYYERFGYIYHPDYYSVFCDNEFTKVADLLNKQVYIDKIIILHRHPINIGESYDGLYLKNERFFARDKETYERRKAQSFDLPVQAE